MEINWTAVFVGAISSAVQGVSTFLTVRYIGRVVDHVEKIAKPETGMGKDEPKGAKDG